MPNYRVQLMGVEHGPHTLGELQAMVGDGTLKPTSLVKIEGGQNWFSATEVPGLYSTREWLLALLLSIFVGGLGVDRFYVGDIGLGILKLVTLGGCGIWSLIDIILIACDKVTDNQGRRLRR